MNSVSTGPGTVLQTAALPWTAVAVTFTTDGLVTVWLNAVNKFSSGPSSAPFPVTQRPYQRLFYVPASYQVRMLLYSPRTRASQRVVHPTRTLLRQQCGMHCAASFPAAETDCVRVSATDAV